MNIFNKIFNKPFRFTKEYIIGRLMEMESCASVYAAQASNAKVSQLRESYQRMSTMYLRRYEWYLNKMMNRKFEEV